MIEIITEHVDMPAIKKYQVGYVKNRWVILDSGKIIHKGKYQDVVFRCYYMNKFHYKNNPEQVK